jgi:hypothetical protein
VVAYPTGNAAFDATVLASENTLASDRAAALAAFANNPLNFATYKAALATADAAHLARVIAAGQANGVTTAPASVTTC